MTVIVTVIMQLLLFLFTIKYKPEWSKNIKISWIKLNSYILLLSSISSILIVIFSHGYENNNVNYVIVSSIGILLFIFFQSLVTDITLRLVDRKIMSFSSILCFVPNLFILISYHMNNTLNFYILFIVACSIFIFIPSIMGASDGRALVLSTVASYPILGINDYLNGFKIMFIFFLFIGVILNLLGSRGKKVSMFTRFFGRASIPAVPIILGSFILMCVMRIVFL